MAVSLVVGLCKISSINSLVMIIGNVDSVWLGPFSRWIRHLPWKLSNHRLFRLTLWFLFNSMWKQMSHGCNPGWISLL